MCIAIILRKGVVYSMDVFTIKKNGKPFMLNIDNFEEMTKKRFPYYQYGVDKKLKCYAICPECGNPIHIINLYGAEMMQNKTGIITTYAKHTRGKVAGFDFWNPCNKEDCPLYNPTPLGNTEIKHNDEYSEELKELIENNKRTIFKNIREVVCINLSTQIINRLYDSFMNSNAYTYKAVTKYNIPYAMLYYQQSISLYGQYIVEGILGDLVSNQINEKSRFFKVENTGEIVKKVTGYKTINMIFKQFKDTGDEKTITMEIYEADEKDHIYTILKEKISLKSYIYS